MQKISTQASKLLPALFEQFDEGQQVSVFHVGPALPETVDFFCGFRCKLHFVDIFSELPFVADEDKTPDLQHQFQNLLQFPPDTLFDICLFWDIFNFLNAEAIAAFLKVLQPHLKESSLAHAFSVHNTKTKNVSHDLYGIRQLDVLSVKDRDAELPGYAPHSQRRLKEMLHCFTVERSVLLPDSRLELVLHTKL